MAARPILVIDTADLPSLLCVIMQVERADVVLWHPRGDDPAAARRLETVRQHAAVLGAGEVVATPVAQFRHLTPEIAAEPPEAQMLLAAAWSARRRNSHRIVWPKCVGPEFRAAAQAVEMMLDVERWLDGMMSAPANQRNAINHSPSEGIQSLEIEMPVLDLTDSQLVDLAVRMDAPMLLWPCVEAGPMACGRCQGCRRWLPALRERVSAA